MPPRDRRIVPWLLSALLVSALAAGRAEAATAAPADEPIIRNTHHTSYDKKDSRIWHTEKRDFPLNKITSFKVTAGKPEPSISLKFVDAEGDELHSHGGPDDWMITRDGDSTSLFRLLADSAPTDQDLFEVDWDNEWKPRLRAARDRFHAKSEGRAMPATQIKWSVRIARDQGAAKDGYYRYYTPPKLTSVTVKGKTVTMKSKAANSDSMLSDTVVPMDEMVAFVGDKQYKFEDVVRARLKPGEKMDDVELLDRLAGTWGDEDAPVVVEASRAEQAAERASAAKRSSMPRGRAPAKLRELKPMPAWKDTPTLNALGRDLTRLASEGKLTQFVGDPSELRSLMRTLVRPTKSALLVGEPGVGKTARAEGLAQLIAEGRVPDELKNKRIIEIPFMNLATDTKYTGEFETKIAAILKEIGLHKDEVIIFIDEAHNMMGLGSHEKSDTDVAELFKAPMARGDLKAIFATTPDEAELFDKDSAFQRRMIKHKVKPSTIAETKKILRGLVADKEAASGKRIARSAIEEAARLGARVPERFLPDSAIDLLDDAIAEAVLAGRVTVDARLIATRFKELTDIEPPARQGSAAAARAGTLEQRLNGAVVGQDRQTKIVAKGVRRAAAGIASEDRPAASYIFAGRSGVGKTLLATQLAEKHFGSKDSLIKIDMGEYADRGSVQDFIQYVFRQVRRRPQSVLLFDEGEKAYGAVHDAMLQMVDEGRVTVGGKTISLKDTVLVMTTNAGMKAKGTQALGFRNGAERAEASQTTDADDVEMKKELRKHFRPEFVNRWGRVILFNDLDDAQVEKIVDLEVAKIQTTARQRRKLKVTMSADARSKLAKDGFTAEAGARDLRDHVEETLGDALADAILDGKVKEGGTAHLIVKDGQIVVDEKAPGGGGKGRNVASADRSPGRRGPARAARTRVR